MNVVGVNGSGRTGGNTAALVRAILRGADDGGATTTLLELATMRIGGCRACKECKQTQRCVQNDDMGRFYDLAADTDVLVLASPVYLGQVTAQTLAFIQRLYCYLGPKIENRYPRDRTRLVLGLTYGAGDGEAYDSILEGLARRLGGYFGLETVATFKIPGASHEPVITDAHPEIWRAYEFGKTLAS